jgi:hypothetical protein
MAKSATATSPKSDSSDSGADGRIAALPLGGMVSVQVVRTPTTVAATKTIIRILGKDRTVQAEQRRIEKVRQSNYNPKRRGGRLYAGRLVKQFPVKGRVGERGSVMATLDVLRDLESVRRFVDVTPA